MEREKGKNGKAIYAKKANLIGGRVRAKLRFKVRESIEKVDLPRLGII